MTEQQHCSFQNVAELATLYSLKYIISYFIFAHGDTVDEKIKVITTFFLLDEGKQWKLEK